MEEKNQSGVVPEHHTGKIIDTESHVDLASEEDAREFFQLVKSRLLNVNSWNTIAGTATADFQLVDPGGREVSRTVQEGDFFKINIPGPGSVTGEGFDWVRVEEINEKSNAGMDSIGIRVRPSPNPQSKSEDIAHFYSEESTSNFTVTREGRRVTAGIYDRNTRPNKGEKNLVDKARDLVVGLGAVAGFSKFQWQLLAQGLVKKES